MSGADPKGHRIAVISDTHNMFRPEVGEVIKTCEVVLHGGDISGPETLEKIRKVCGESASSRIGGAGNFYVVRGNNDRDWAQDIPYSLEVRLFGRRFFMTHKKKDIPEDVDADVVIYGHSHKFAQDYEDGTLYLNPGSCGPGRFNKLVTMAVLTVPDPDPDAPSELKSGITVEKIEIPNRPREAVRESSVVKREQVTAGLIRGIGDDIRRNRTVAEIAARRSVSRELAEEIVRLYVTHPGVTPEQVMSKMGL